MVKVYQPIVIDNFQQISEKLYQYVVHHTDILTKKLPWNQLVKDDVLRAVPELQDELDAMIPLEIEMIVIFYTPPKFAGGVHVDIGDFEYRFLMPVYNCAGSYTKFFDLNGNNVVMKYSNEKEKIDPYYAIEEKNPLIEIASVETINPMLIRVKTPHGIYNNPLSDEPRLTCTIAFHNNSYLKHFLK